MLKVVKIGGNVVDNSEKLDRFLQDFASLEGPKVLVHGGGKIATTIGKALGIETQMIGGRRVTDAETLKVVTMVYAGLINKTIVAKLRTAGCNAVGLCGADGGLIVSGGCNRSRSIRFRRRSGVEAFRDGDCENADRRPVIRWSSRRLRLDGADGSRSIRTPIRWPVRWPSGCAGTSRPNWSIVSKKRGVLMGCRRRPQRDPGDYAGAVCAASCGRDRGGRYAAETRECVRRD